MINYLLYSYVGTSVSLILIMLKVVLSMFKLSKDYDVNVRFENMPNSILGVFVEVFDKPYIVLNDILHTDMHDFITYACCYFHNKGITGKITFNDLENTNFEPFHYARKKLKKNVC
jgi:hypothetical protein